MVRRITTVALAALSVAAFAPAVAFGDTGDIIAPQHTPGTAADGWQAGVCNTDVPECSPESPDAQYSTQAATHPPIGFTQFITKDADGGLLEPVGVLKGVRVDLPAGLSVNPQATAQCELATFQENALACPATSVVGASLVTLAVAGLPVGPVPTQVYNIVPNQGEPALFGFDAAGSEVYLKADVDWSGDYHEGFTIAVPPPPLGRIYKNRLVFTGIAGNGTFLTNPSTCRDPANPEFAHTYSTFLRADSVESPNATFPAGSTAFEAPLPAGVKPTGCDLVPFSPAISVSPGIVRTDAPVGPAVDVTVPFDPVLPIAHSNVETASTTLPDGMGLNPSAAGGLEFCSDAQLGKGTRDPVACPAKSKIGTIAVNTPPLPDGSLTGPVFIGKQLSRDPESGNEYRIFVDAESARYGISARLIGKVKANRKTGQLTTTFAQNPQVPFTSFKLDFDDGPKAVLTSPPTCGPNKTTTSISPYSGTPAATPAHEFGLTKAPGDGPCAKSLAERPFSPGFSTRSKSLRAGAYSPFAVHIGRANGQQELKGVDLSLPPGVTGKLKGIPYCKPDDIVKAAGRAGEAEAKNSTCPDKSLVGRATIRAGSGTPIAITGKAFLAGPFDGAPLSLAVITPATAGPFDLGTVVVRVALSIDPETARIRPHTDAIPHVFGGAKLSIRSIDVNANKQGFILNGTSCRKLDTSGSVLGGGGDPNAPAKFSAAAVNAGFQVNACRKLKFRPKLFTKVLSGRKTAFRAQNPKFRAILVARKGHANVSRTVVKLPNSMILDQAHIRTLCTRPQLAERKCPKGSVYGHAAATSPLLGKKLKGPVYLVPGKKILPDLLVDLRGQVNIRLRGTVEAVGGRLRNIFTAPDVPVAKFVLTMNGGKRGLLTNTRDLCRGAGRSKVTLRGQNGKRVRSNRVAIKVPACRSVAKKKR
ncbi:MAG TPA: hypothetical protein VIT85_02700 [Solirubrobacterales bacterium]